MVRVNFVDNTDASVINTGEILTGINRYTYFDNDSTTTT